MDKKQYKLCMVDGEKAFFTTNPLNEQWGDDWNDTPYEDNAGPPYRNESGDNIFIVYYELGSNCISVLEPKDDWKKYSIEEINSKLIPWIKFVRIGNNDKIVRIFPGTTFEEFEKMIFNDGGTIYYPKRNL